MTSTQKMEAARSYETSVTTYQAVQNRNVEEHNPSLHWHGNFRLHVLKKTVVTTAITRITQYEFAWMDVFNLDGM
jgi:hypothetical protein